MIRFSSVALKLKGQGALKTGINAICIQKHTILSLRRKERESKWIHAIGASRNLSTDGSNPPKSTENEQKPDLQEDKSSETLKANIDQTTADPKVVQDPKDPKSSYYGATVQKIGSTLHFAEQKYEDFEGKVMSRLQESNRRRFRIYFFGSIGVVLAISIVFGSRIRKGVTNQTAALAKETLENESLKIQTQELAMAVVQTVLNDKEVTAHAANFLKQASTTPETQKALLDLTLHVLQHPQTLEELIKMSKKLIHDLSEDKVISCFQLIFLFVFF
jgi:hypothetical protein